MVSPGEVHDLVSGLRARRARLTSLTEQGAAVQLDELLAEIAELGQELLAADEELRAQQEQLDAARAALVAMVDTQATNLDVQPATVVTNPVGTITWRNDAAGQLCQLESLRASRPIATRFAMADRHKIRSLITSLGRTVAGTTAETEAVLVRPDGTQVPTRVCALAVIDSATGARALRWELHPLDAGRRLRAVPEPSSTPAPAVLSALNAITDAFAAGADVDELCQLLFSEARKLVPEAENFALVVRQGKRVAHLTATGDAAQEALLAQCELRQGPTLTAMDSGQPETVHVMRSIAPRWPKYTKRAAEWRIGSELAVPFAAQNVTGALTAFGQAPGTLDGAAVEDLRLLVKHAGAAIAEKVLEGNLRAAVTSHREVGKAIGILIERHRLTEEEAFGRLVRASQTRHAKLRVIAETVVQTGQDPETI